MPRRDRSRAASPAARFAALGDATRLALVARLARGGPMSIANLTAGTRISRQAVRKHLRVLERAGLAHGARRGRESLWRLETVRLEEARRDLERISTQWDAALERLRRFVEE